MARIFVTYFLIGAPLISATHEQNQKRAHHVESLGRKLTVRNSPLQGRQDCQVFDVCYGECDECFGTGFTRCPGNSTLCHNPGNDCYPMEMCTENYDSNFDTSGSSSLTSSSSIPSAVPSNYTSSAYATSTVESGPYGTDSTSTMDDIDKPTSSASSISAPGGSGPSTSSNAAVATPDTTASTSDLAGASGASTATPAAFQGGAASQPFAINLLTSVVLAMLGCVVASTHLLAI